jgi:hypothetical protein
VARGPVERLVARALTELQKAFAVCTGRGRSSEVGTVGSEQLADRDWGEMCIEVAENDTLWDMRDGLPKQVPEAGGVLAEAVRWGVSADEMYAGYLEDRYAIRNDGVCRRA